MGPEAGGYGMYTLRGATVAGFGPQQMTDIPPFWTVYVSVADVAATATAVVAAGGTVVAPPIEVFESGSMAVFQDPAGTFISAWQPKEHIGAELVNEASTFRWNDLAAVDIDAARTFYSAVFGWEVDDTTGSFTLEGQLMCGARQVAEGEPPAWLVWFSVVDCDSSAAQVVELGGSVVVGPNDEGGLRSAAVADPTGAVFGLVVVDPNETPAD